MRILLFFLIAVAQCTESEGQEESSLPPLLNIRTIISLVLLAILVGLSQAGGIGGGPIISPVMMALLQLGSRRAVWNTYVMLFGGSLGSYLKLGRERVKSSGSPLINFKLVLITLPLLLAGAVFGVAVGRSLPKLVIAILLFLVLIQVIIKTYKTYQKLRNQEIAQDSQKKEQRQSWIELVYYDEQAYTYKEQKIDDPTQVHYNQEIRPDQLQLTSLTTDLIFKSPKLIQIYESEKNLYPWKTLGNIILQVSIVIFISMLKGSSQIPSLLGIELCSWTYQLMNVLLLAVGLVSIFFYKKQFLEDEDFKEKLGYDFKREGKLSLLIDGTVKNSLLAGFLGGLVGLGGGVVLTPLWLEMGIPSTRATSSATFTVLFTSFISMFSIFLIGGYKVYDILILGLVACSGSYVISGFLKKLVQKFKRESIIIQILIGVIAFGLTILPVNAINEIQKDPAGSLKFGVFC